MGAGGSWRDDKGGREKEWWEKKGLRKKGRDELAIMRGRSVRERDRERRHREEKK